jgi:peptidoglycan hydrolase-like protein with peptidoglycan-binding domain
VIDALAAVAFALPADDAVTPEEPKKAPPLTEVYAGKARIKTGMEGKSVERLQMMLSGVGKPTTGTGVFDEQTRKAYKSFQEKFGYWPTGIVTQKPALRLKKLYGKGNLPDACMKGRVLCIDKTQLVLRMMKNGRQQLVTDVRFGAEQTPTRNGRFRVFSKVRYLISDLAGTPMPFSLFFSGGQAVHFSPGFRRDGYNGASLGCVNVRNYKDARTIYRSSPLGTTVYVYRS